ncbi:Flp pilus assembly protein TadG [Saccharopolyspora lacisalsi]|uniref:Flp pilus assembly protein TadG n=1 Tax=Halosaccharopolyspora lacisalsi TaxID=1000566 RepID=A0A839DST6_9PSEU|nr:pilus assembly protein TadG-related protein [Halosaccharopolyspora lacisalsi]MBA8823809.1 Flp pilus assembly protein TadG [Halosaccharopolyspora lacisalsi]
MTRRGRGLITDEQGRVTAFVVILTTACLLFAGLVLDGGLALAAKIRAIGHAEEAARAGAQELALTVYRDNSTVQLQPAAVRAAARQYLDTVGAHGTVTVADNTVSVTVTAEQPTQLLELIGITTTTVSGSGHAQPHQGQLGGQ